MACPALSKRYLLRTQPNKKVLLSGASYLFNSMAEFNCKILRTSLSLRIPDPVDLASLVESLIFREAKGTYRCKKCSYKSHVGSHVRNHVTSMHLAEFAPRFPCTLCTLTLKTENSRRKHYKVVHKINVTCRQIKEVEEGLPSPFHALLTKNATN